MAAADGRIFCLAHLALMPALFYPARGEARGRAPGLSSHVIPSKNVNTLQTPLWSDTRTQQQPTISFVTQLPRAYGTSARNQGRLLQDAHQILVCAGGASGASLPPDRGGGSGARDARIAGNVCAQSREKAWQIRKAGTEAWHCAKCIPRGIMPDIKRRHVTKILKHLVYDGCSTACSAEGAQIHDLFVVRVILTEHWLLHQVWTWRRARLHAHPCRAQWHHQPSLLLLLVLLLLLLLKKPQIMLLLVLLVLLVFVDRVRESVPLPLCVVLVLLRHCVLLAWGVCIPQPCLGLIVDASDAHRPQVCAIQL